MSQWPTSESGNSQIGFQMLGWSWGLAHDGLTVARIPNEPSVKEF